MKKYVLLKTNKENYPYIIDVFRMLLGNALQIEESDTFLKVEYQDAKDTEISATIESLESDLNALITSYQTTTLKPNKEIEIVKDLFLRINYGHYQFKTLILNIRDKLTALEVFQFIIEGSGVTEDIILAMADCDLNVSKASVLLFMHRNTLLYKIERLISLSDFDLKNFNDLYILVQLLRAK
ncbi:MAG: helix-turn-helix domain-containing protein [Roseburia sp.]|nr:helix-turn-helix domain-containing protein [Anaeroplasma bactoclasticum]MCM1196056.1 helix-turn-helix domain-containing protein [Roseburia sp.]MCM1556741.1 helix-turn-helix domain-containing protein [Anaeroplasma bactoclasticum]